MYETSKCDVVVAVCIDVLKLFTVSLRFTCSTRTNAKRARQRTHKHIDIATMAISFFTKRPRVNAFKLSHRHSMALNVYALRYEWKQVKGITFDISCFHPNRKCVCVWYSLSVVAARRTKRKMIAVGAIPLFCNEFQLIFYCVMHKVPEWRQNSLPLSPFAFSFRFGCCQNWQFKLFMFVCVFDSWFQWITFAKVMQLANIEHICDMPRRRRTRLNQQFSENSTLGVAHTWTNCWHLNVKMNTVSLNWFCYSSILQQNSRAIFAILINTYLAYKKKILNI